MNLARWFARFACGALCAMLACAAPVTRAAAAAPPHLDLQIEFDPGTRHLRAVAEFPATAHFRLALHQSLNVTGMHVNGRAVALPAVQRNGDQRIWQMDTPVHAALRLEYGGTLPALDRTLDHREVLQIRAPMADTQGSFLASATHWYPAIAARFTYRVTLSLPPDQRGLVAGRLAAESLPARQRLKEYGRRA